MDTSKKNAYFCIYKGYSMKDVLLLLTIKKYLEAIFYPFEVENIKLVIYKLIITNKNLRQKNGTKQRYYRFNRNLQTT